MAKKSTPKKHVFTTEIKQLLNIMINSLYSHKEIFLRELISNAADACEKLRFDSLTNPKLLNEHNKDLKILVEVNQEEGYIEIIDNGIGMDEDEVVNNLGTIAKSGTSEFIKNLQEKDNNQQSQMIGQFGVGFYSSFMVAKEVEVFTRKTGTKKTAGIYWKSSGDGEFTIENKHIEQEGTSVRLHIKDDSSEFLNDFLVRQIVQNYSNYIHVPIFFKKNKDANEALNDDESKEKSSDSDSEKIDGKTEGDTQNDYELVTSSVAIWQKKPNKEITTEEYKEFYQNLTHDYNEPLTWAHNKVEGNLEYISLLYIPSKAPLDMWQRGDSNTKGLKLFVQRVFIMDKVQIFLPNYLRFVRGVIDTNDLDLNISREILQQSPVVLKLKQALTRRVLEMLLKLTEEDHQHYLKFWKQFSMSLKEGFFEEKDEKNKEILMKLFRFYSTHGESEEPIHTLADYLGRMRSDQKNIYYLLSDSYEKGLNNPLLEAYRKENCEVLILTDAIDDWFATSLNNYEGKDIKNIAQSNSFEFDKNEKELDQDEKDFIEKIKSALSDEISDVKISSRLTDAASCMIQPDNHLSANMRRVLEMAGQSAPKSKGILEINAEHFLVKKLKNEQDESNFKNLAEVIYSHALLLAGENLTNPAKYIEQLDKIIENK